MAKLEWRFESAYYCEEPQTCLCGHYPIKNVCVIKNKENLTQTEVGNCCIKKFLGLNGGDKIFDSIKKIRLNEEKSMNPETLDYLYQKGGINDFEYNFYVDIINKRKLSDKQLDIKKRINQKLLRFTIYETNSHFSLIKSVLKWAQDNTWYNTGFVLSLKSHCEKNGKLTDRQKECLDDIMRKHGISNAQPT